MPTLGGAEDAEIALPLPLAADAASQRGREDYNVIGKLKPGVTVAAAQAEMDAITARLRRDFPADLYPPNGGLTFGIVPLQEQVVGDVRRSVLVLLALSVACCCRLRQRRQPDALARRWPTARDRHSRGHSAPAAAHRPPVADRERAAGAGRRRAWSAPGAVVGLDWMRAIGQGSVPRLGEIHHRASSVLLFTLAALADVRPALRPGSGAARQPDRSARAVERRSRAPASGALWSRGQRPRACWSSRSWRFRSCC